MLKKWLSNYKCGNAYDMRLFCGVFPILALFLNENALEICNKCLLAPASASSTLTTIRFIIEPFRLKNYYRMSAKLGLSKCDDINHFYNIIDPNDRIRFLAKLCFSSLFGIQYYLISNEKQHVQSAHDSKDSKDSKDGKEQDKHKCERYAFKRILQQMTQRFCRFQYVWHLQQLSKWRNKLHKQRMLWQKFQKIIKFLSGMSKVYYYMAIDNSTYACDHECDNHNYDQTGIDIKFYKQLSFRRERNFACFLGDHDLASSGFVEANVVADYNNTIDCLPRKNNSDDVATFVGVCEKCCLLSSPESSVSWLSQQLVMSVLNVVYAQA